MCCGWCTLEVVLSLFNVLNEHFSILVKHIVIRSILTNWYSFAIDESIKYKFKTNGHITYPCIRNCHVEVPFSEVTGKYLCSSPGMGEVSMQQSRSLSNNCAAVTVKGK